MQTLIAIGTVYRDRSDFDKAKKWYGRAAKIDPASFDANYQMGYALQLLNKPREATRYYAYALAVEPNNGLANREMASALLQLGEANKSLLYAKRATQIDPESQEAWYNLATTYNLLGRYEEAIDAYRAAAELGELVDTVLLGLADAHIHLENYERAEATLNAVSEAGRSAIVYERLGYIAFKQKRYAEAVSYYEEALEIDTNDIAVLNGLGACLMTQYMNGGRKEVELRNRAYAAWRKSILVDEDQPLITDLINRFRRL